MSHSPITGDKIATKPSKDVMFRKGYRAATPEEAEFVRLTNKEAESRHLGDVVEITEKEHG